jgi:hypothetical protein
MSSTVAAAAAIRNTDSRVTSYGWKALAGSVVGYSMDGFDLLIVSFMLPAISADLHLANAQTGGHMDVNGRLGKCPSKLQVDAKPGPPLFHPFLHSLRGCIGVSATIQEREVAHL